MIGQKQMQVQVQMTAYSWEVSHDTFVMMMETLEKYIEVSGYYSDWSSRKTILDNRVRRQDPNSEEAESTLTTILLIFGTILKNKPPLYHDKLKQEFYQWIDKTKIDVNNCPLRLKYVLFGINETLEGNRRKILKDGKNCKKPNVNSPEYAEALCDTFAGMQVALQNERELAQSLADKTYQDIEIENRFSSGNAEQGEKVFELIKESISLRDYQEKFYFFPQQQEQQKEEFELCSNQAENSGWMRGYVASETQQNNVQQINYDESIIGKRKSLLDEYHLARKKFKGKKPLRKGETRKEVKSRMIQIEKEVGIVETRKWEEKQDTIEKIIHRERGNWIIKGIFSSKIQGVEPGDMFLIHRSAYKESTDEIFFESGKVYKKKFFLEEEWMKIEDAINSYELEQRLAQIQIPPKQQNQFW